MHSYKNQIKTILNITRYSIKMFFRDRTAVYFSLFIPLLIMSIFGVLNFDSPTKVNLAIADEATNPLSSQVVSALEKIDTLNITKKSKDSALSDLKKGNGDLVLVFPSDFGSNVAKYQQEKAKNLTSAKIESQNIELYENQNSTSGSVQIGATILEKVFDNITHQVSNTPNLFVLDQKTVATVKHSYIDFIIPGVAAMSVMQLSIFGVLGAIVSWRERGILKRLLATPIKPSNIIFSQVVTRLIITLLQVTVLVTIGVVFFRLVIVGSIPLIYFLAFLGGVVFLSMGFAVSAFANSQNTVMAVANLIMMPQMFLSGVFFPRDALPALLQKITDFFPLTYLSTGMREVMINGATIYQVRTEVFGLLIWGLVVFFLASRFFRWE